jgi:hypothetical protein
VNPELRRFPLLVALLAVVVAPIAAAPPPEFPIFEQEQDINPCTGELITLTFEGVIRVQEVGDHLVLHSSGTVTTDDGGFGAFQSQEIIHDEHVATFRSHDMELYADGQRVVFGFIGHITVVNGELTADVSSGSLRCVGKP